MSTRLDIAPEPIFYPESDGKPMAENTLQFDWITMLVGELRVMYRDRADVFVAGDLFWYPVEGFPAIVQAPDTLVAFGRPKGYRPSYKQWQESGIAPQVVFEVLSPSNDDDGMGEKFTFYERHGVDEYYVIDPFTKTVEGWKRRGKRLIKIAKMNGWTSPQLGIRFETSNGELIIRTPSGRQFVYQEDRAKEFFEELARRDRELQEEREKAQRELKTERENAQRERENAQHERENAQREREKAQREQSKREGLAAKLRELGIDPDSIRSE